MKHFVDLVSAIFLTFLLSEAVDFKSRKQLSTEAVGTESTEAVSLESLAEAADGKWRAFSELPADDAASAATSVPELTSLPDLPSLPEQSSNLLVDGNLMTSDPAFGVESEVKHSLSSPPTDSKHSSLADIAAAVQQLPADSQVVPNLDAAKFGAVFVQAVGADHREQIDGLEQTVMGLAKMGGYLDPGDFAPRDAIHHLVNDTMKMHLVSEARDAEEKLRQLLTNFDSCVPTYHWSEFKGYFDNHTLCRKNQSNYIIELEHANKSWNQSYHRMLSACHNFSLIDVIPRFDECEIWGLPAAVRLTAEERRDKFKAKFLAWNESFTSCEVAKRNETMSKERVKLLIALLRDTTIRCVALQTDMDQRACDLNIEDCSKQSKCYHDVLCSYEAEYKNAADLEKALNPQYRTLERILCILSALKSEDVDSEIDDCKARTYSAEPVSIDWTELQVPAMGDCGAEIPWPNSSFYGKIVTDSIPSNVKRDDCFASPCCMGHRGNMEPCQNCGE
mmetsp:Transcript_15491/g.27171  ORF Transcript_15491/g.27171 Transcript_15491/m.27171 type:complete len:506 (+) Transcript_15491:95-1612(+)